MQISLTETAYKSLNGKIFLITLFLDLMKTFYTGNHSILQEKIEVSGISGNVSKWFENYFRNSEWKKVNNGVSQRSLLGSVLFLVYINNFPTVSSLLHSVLFAADTCLTSADDNFSNLMKTFHSELKYFMSC